MESQSSHKKASSESSDGQVDEELTPEALHRLSILKQKRVLRRYLRLKRNNYVKHHEELLTDQFYLDKYLPKIEQILDEN